MSTWKIDPIHSEVKFKVKHLVISTVTGQFKKFEGSIESSNENFSDAKIQFEADVNSISTNNDMRDNHLKSPDFFDAANHPKLTYISRSFNKISDDEYEMTGDMTIRGITKELKMKVTYNGRAIGMDGSHLAGFEIFGKLNRFDFGLHWNTITEAGGVAVGSEIKLEIFAEMKLAAEIGIAA